MQYPGLFSCAAALRFHVPGYEVFTLTPIKSQEVTEFVHCWFLLLFISYSHMRITWAPLSVDVRPSAGDVPDLYTLTLCFPSIHTLQQAWPSGTQQILLPPAWQQLTHTSVQHATVIPDSMTSSQPLANWRWETNMPSPLKKTIVLATV